MQFLLAKYHVVDSYFIQFMDFGRVKSLTEELLNHMSKIQQEIDKINKR